MKLTKKPFEKGMTRSEQAIKSRRGKSMTFVEPARFKHSVSGRTITVPPGTYYVQGDITRIK